MTTETTPLTIPAGEIAEAEWTPAWLIEVDLEHASVQVFGKANVTRWTGGDGITGLVSDETGGSYSESHLAGGCVELFTAEEHWLAVFPTEDAMRAGARVILEAYGDQLPLGIHRALSRA